MYTMLTQAQTQKFALEQQTVVDNILKEHYQLFMLDILFNAPFESRLVFKGGTALRLAYGSVRFSEDLDFSLLDEVAFSEHVGDGAGNKEPIPSIRHTQSNNKF